MAYSLLSAALTALPESPQQRNRLYALLLPTVLTLVLPSHLLQEHARALAVRLLDVASSKVSGIAAPFSKSDAALLLSDPRVELSSRGDFKVLQERIFENREHIIRMLDLDASRIECVPTAAEAAAAEDDDPLLCTVCNGDATELKPILKCDGPHDVEVGYHLDCLPALYVRQSLPPDHEAWLCPKCMDANIYILEAVKEKKPMVHPVGTVVCCRSGTLKGSCEAASAKQRRQGAEAQ